MQRIALVTGGTRGIGRAISVALKEAGHKVAANYAGNDEAARKFVAETGIAVFKFDIANFETCRIGIGRIEQELGPIEILVNNAGITRDAMLHKSARQIGRLSHNQGELLPHHEATLTHAGGSSTAQRTWS